VNRGDKTSPPGRGASRGPYQSRGKASGEHDPCGKATGATTSRGQPAPKRADGFARLQTGLTGERRLIGVSYMDDPELLRVYRDYYWPVSREQARYVLRALRRQFPRGFAAVADIGSGPGPVAAAFAEDGTRELLLVDQSVKALDLARTLVNTGLTGNASLPEPAVPAEPAALRLETRVGDAGNAAAVRASALHGRVDCVSFGHSLNELFAGLPDRVERRAALLGQYAESLSVGGIILVIEPALLATSRDALALRDLLIAQGWSTLAPCPGRSRLPCPALAAGAQQTCHAEISWTPPDRVAALASEAGLDKDTLKMVWFAFAPPGWQAPPGWRPEPDEVYRVVSEPMLNKAGRLRRLLCGSSGRFPISAVAGGAEARRTGLGGFFRGDLVTVVQPELRENGWGIGPATRLVPYPEAAPHA